MTTMQLFKQLCIILFICIAPCLHATNDQQKSQSSQEMILDKDTTERQQAEDGQFGHMFTRMLSMLALTLLLFIIGAYLAKRFLHLKYEGSSKSGAIRIIERRPLSQKSALYLVEIENEQFVIVEFPSGGQVLRRMRFEQEPLSRSIS